MGITSHAQVTVNTSPDPLIACDINNNGLGTFDLTQANADIVLGDPTLIVSYHISLFDAQTGVNPLSSPFYNTIPYRQVVFARVENTQGDFALVELELWVDIPPLSSPNDLYQDDDDGDGLAVFDLTVNDAVVLNGLDAPYYSVSYYEGQEDADNGVNFIIDPSAYQNLNNPQLIYVRVKNLNANCYALASFSLIVDALSVDSFGFGNLKMFPNPSSENITIQSALWVSETNISIYDIVGKMLISENITPQNGAITLDVSSLKNAIYFLKIRSEGNEAVLRLIKN